MTSKLQSGVRFKAYPTPVQAGILARWIGCQRFVYNGKVGEDGLFTAQWHMDKRDYPLNPHPTPLDNTYSQFKDDELSPWLSEVPSQVLRQGVCRWRDAKQRQLGGLAKAPRKRNRTNFISVRLDSDMFEFKEQVDWVTGEVTQELHLGGTGKYAMGVLQFKAHREYGLPKMLSISRKGGQWFVSFSYEHDSPVELRTSQELAYEVDLLSDAELQACVVGLDRNVKDNAFYSSTGQAFMLEDKVLERIVKKKQRTIRYQRQFSRCKKGSKNQAKARAQLAESRQYEADALRDFSHKTSHTVVHEETVKVIALEKLNLAGMVRAPKPKQDKKGRYLKNGASAKAALNTLLLGRALGATVHNIGYKAARVNKLVVFVPAQYSSQECSRCGHTHPDNRHEQRFVCQRCNFTAHADFNASCVIKKRAIALVRSKELQAPAKAVKRVSVRRKPKPHEIQGAGSSG
jgi:putative transposase